MCCKESKSKQKSPPVPVLKVASKRQYALNTYHLGPPKLYFPPFVFRDCIYQIPNGNIFNNGIIVTTYNTRSLECMIVFQCHKLLLRIFLNVITTVLLFIFTYFLFCAIPSLYMGMQINCCCCCCCCCECIVCFFSPPLLTYKGGSFEPLEPPLLRAWRRITDFRNFPLELFPYRPDLS